MQWEWMTDPRLGVGGFLVLPWVLKSSLVIVNHLSKGHVNWRAVCMCVCVWVGTCMCVIFCYCLENSQAAYKREKIKP